MDGAHTVESVQLCAEWFRSRTTGRRPARNLLLFNVTGARNAQRMLAIVRRTVRVDEAMFAPNVAKRNADGPGESELAALATMADSWRELGGDGEATEPQVFGSVEEVLLYLRRRHDGADGLPANVLVTGSLYMVGAVCEMTALMQAPAVPV